MNGAEITIAGNIARFELKFGPSGNAWGYGAVAVSEFTTKNGERSESTTFIEFKIFGQIAENLAESADKGTRVMVMGKLREDKYKAQDGSDRSRMVLYVDEVGTSLRWAKAKIEKVSGNGGNGGGNGQRQYAQSAPEASSAPAGDSFDAGSGDNPFL
jgi:single-strand DNA-binding protein